MKANTRILSVSLLSLAIEIAFLCLLMYFSSYLFVMLPSTSDYPYRLPMICFLVLCTLYLLFSNTKYRSLSSLLLGYKLETQNNHFIRVVLSNVLFYGIVLYFTWLQIENITSLIYQIVRIVLLIELGSCFIPKINTRLSLYLLQINVKYTEKKKPENDGIML